MNEDICMQEKLNEMNDSIEEYNWAKTDVPSCQKEVYHLKLNIYNNGRKEIAVEAKNRKLHLNLNYIIRSQHDFITIVDITCDKLKETPLHSLTYKAKYINVNLA